MKAAPLLRVPVLVTEQNPKRLGRTGTSICHLQLRNTRAVLIRANTRTASEVGVDGAEGVRVFEKLKFSMLTDEVREVLEKDYPERKDVLLLGIEVYMSRRNPLGGMDDV